MVLLLGCKTLEQKVWGFIFGLVMEIVSMNKALHSYVSLFSQEYTWVIKLAHGVKLQQVGIPIVFYWVFILSPWGKTTTGWHPDCNVLGFYTQRNISIHYRTQSTI